MTMLSFRIDAALAAQVQRWVDRLGVERSEFLREALRRHLVKLQSEVDAETWVLSPASDAELSLAAVADWGPAEDWSDWDDAAG